ncbi:MAG: FAD-dependent oxidoreductase [Halioglobus sp.]
MNIPKVCLVGVGHFGKAHLHEWLKLQESGEVQVFALVVSTEASRAEHAANYAIPVFTSLDEELLAQADIVDIVTPAESHLTLIEKCLPHCHVLVEKPMVMSLAELEQLEALERRYPERLMVGHNYRFNQTVIKLGELIEQQPELPSLVEITMLNESSSWIDLNPNLEYVHAFDIMDCLFELEPEIESSRCVDNSHQVSIRYGGSLHCVMSLGWHKKPSKRSIHIVYPEMDITCDLFRYSIRVNRNSHFDTHNLPHDKTALRDEMLSFLRFFRAECANPVSVEVAARSLKTALRTTPKIRKRTPTVAVIGGGVFGANCALELNHFCNVSLFERHAELMEETSFANQWRHHSGFHYPRSYDTIQEIRSTKRAFEDLYGDSVVNDYTSYFCPSASGVEIPAERYLAACSSNYLSFSIEYPPADIVERDTISISLKTDEGVYDFYKLRKMIEQRLANAANTQTFTSANILGAEILPDGTKQLSIERDGKVETEVFDYLINATYSNRNLLTKWFSFPVEPLRFDLYEMLVVRLPIEQICVTIIDGPFTSLVGMGYDNLFLLSHIHDSVLRSEVTADGMPPDWGHIQSNRHNMLLSASKYIPVLKEAEVVESRYATRAVNAYARDFDARPSVIRNHGFDCWSVMGGKIVTCVSNAREIATMIEKSHAK